MRKLLLIAAVVLFLAGQSWAASDTRNPTGDGIVAGTVSGSSPTRYQAVDDYPDTTPTDYLQFGTTANSEHTFTFTALTIPAGSTSISVDVLYYDAEPANGTNSSAGRLRVGGTQYSSATHNPSGTTYTSRTKSWATNPKSTVAWTVDDVNGVGTNALQQFGMIGPDSNPAWRVSSVQLKVNYTPPANSGFQTSSPTGRHGATMDGALANQIRAQKYVCGGAGTQEITEIGAWVSAVVATTGVFRLAIFTHDSVNDNPDTMVANSESAELSHNTETPTKKSHTYGTKPQLTGGTTYWIVIFYGDANINTDRNSTGGSLVYEYTPTYPTWPAADSWDAFLDGTADLGIYAVYQAVAPSTSIKTVLGVAKASVKTVDGLAIGSVKSIDGLQ
jgi:hypothetical protein